MIMTMRAVGALLAVTAIASAEPPPQAQSPRKPQAPPAKQAQPMTKPGHAMGGAVFANPRDVKWMPAPPELPQGAQVAVLAGNPTKPERYTMRLKLPNGYKAPPHWHTQDEQVTVLAGNLALYLGDSMTSQPHVLEPGGYHFLPGGMHHAAEARGETVLQISGHGPYDFNYVNPADKPPPRAAKR